MGRIKKINKQKGFAPIIILIGILILVLAGGAAYYYFKIRTPEARFCTMDAKICPDGSAVGRSGSNCEFAPCPSSPPASGSAEVFESVTINQLVTNMNKFENKNVSVKGIYAEMPTITVMCVPTASGSAPRISEEYQLYPTTWVITKGSDILGVKVLDKNNAINSTLPNYKIREEIELKGIARTATVPAPCSSNVRHKSVYLEVKEEDVNITLKPLPQNPPTSNDRIQIPDCNKGPC